MDIVKTVRLMLQCLADNVCIECGLNLLKPEVMRALNKELQLVEISIPICYSCVLKSRKNG